MFASLLKIRFCFLIAFIFSPLQKFFNGLFIVFVSYGPMGMVRGVPFVFVQRSCFVFFLGSMIFHIF